MICIDIQEKEPILKAMKDARHVHLYHPDGRRSYDYQVTTQANQTIRIERKSCSDAVNSFLAKEKPCCRLCRQARSVDALIVEWNEVDVARLKKCLANPTIVDSALKHIWRLALDMPVLFTTGPLRTMMALRYLESKDEPLSIRRSPTTTTTPPPPGVEGSASASPSPPPSPPKRLCFVCCRPIPYDEQLRAVHHVADNAGIDTCAGGGQHTISATLGSR